MKTTITIVLCLTSFFPALGQNGQKLTIINKYSNNKAANTNDSKQIINSPSKAKENKDPTNTMACMGNGVVTFMNTASQPLWFYYWYPEDVVNTANECRFRRFWKQLNTGSNSFIIPKNKTLIFRIYISTKCQQKDIKQFGIVHYCNTNNAIIKVN